MNPSVASKANNRHAPEQCCSGLPPFVLTPVCCLAKEKEGPRWPSDGRQITAATGSCLALAALLRAALSPGHDHDDEEATAAVTSPSSPNLTGLIL